MCEVCARKAALADMLRPMLAPGVELHLVEGEGYQDLLLIGPTVRMTLTADGDPGGYSSYFHWKPEAVVPAPKPAEPVRADGLVVLPLENVGGGRTGTLSPSLTAEQITERLGCVPNRGGNGDGKVENEWSFSVDGEECAVWDYKGSKWSYGGSTAAMRKLFGNHVTEDKW